MANVDTFPLLKLPYLPIANVIHQFISIHKRVYLATLSRRAAVLVKSLNDIKVLGLKLTVSNSLNLSVIYLDHGTIEGQGWMYKRNPDTPDFPFLVDYNYLQKLVDAIFFIFHLSGFEELVVEWDGTMEMSRLQNLLRSLNTIKFGRVYSNTFHKHVLAAFPSVRNVSMTTTPNNQLLTEKLEILEISSQRLYGLGLVNCESLQLPTPVLHWIELNHFLKKWIQGRMPRSKHILIQYAIPLRQDLIFKGIEYRKANQNRQMTFKSYSLNLGDLKTTVVQGGLDIKSENGAMATITTQDEGNGFQLWNMNVWD